MQTNWKNIQMTIDFKQSTDVFVTNGHVKNIQIIITRPSNDKMLQKCQKYESIRNANDHKNAK